MANKNQSSSKSKSDDRNLIEAAAAGNIDFEDQIRTIWEENKKLIVLGIAAVFAIFVGYHLYKMISRQAEASVQRDFAEASSSEEKLAFAESKSSHPLGGFAFKQLADEAYSSGDYETAIERYRRAAESAESAIQDAAKMGEAVSLAQLDRFEESRKILQSLVDAGSTNQAEGRYRLLSLAVSSEDWPNARRLLEEIQTTASRENLYWLQKAMAFESQIPPVES